MDKDGPFNRGRYNCSAGTGLLRILTVRIALALHHCSSSAVERSINAHVVLLGPYPAPASARSYYP